MFLWWSVFVTPLAASTLEWAILSSRRPDQLRHVTVVLAVAFTTMAALWGIWTLLHFPGMLLVPESTAHKVLSTGFLLATLGGFATVTWAAIERHWLSWMALAISGWIFVVWMVMILAGD